MAEDKGRKNLTPEQKLVVKNKKKELVVSASAGSGKTFVVVEKLIDLICKEKVKVSRLLVLTFTKAAANELKTRLYTEILNQETSPFLLEQLDDIMLSDISTIDAFCEKVIKRNINKLSIPQNFVILDEKGAKALKNNAFKRAEENFSQSNKQEFEDIYFAFKRNSSSMEECLHSIQSFLDSDRNGDELKEKLKENLSLYHQKACDFLKEKIKNGYEKSRAILNEAKLEADMGYEALAKGHLQFIENLDNFLNVDFEKDLFNLCKEISNRKVPSLSSAKCDKDIKEKLTLAKEEALVCFDLASLLQHATDQMIDSAQQGRLAGEILSFYEVYQKEYTLLKERRYALDFADLEKYARILLEDEEVEKSLQEKYDYIIIDEYQDTNRLQEAFLKPIAKGGAFIAVGDIKQGIYGFRNASKEIMSEDIERLTNSPDGEVLFLRGNFRTDERILAFVNTIFEKLMTIESVGIDYKETSMLEGKNKFLPNSLPAVNVDIVCNSKKEEEDRDEWEDVYSVKEDCVRNSYKFLDEISTIAYRIDEVLKEKIYSPKTKTFRQVEQGDIALLFRNRSPLMQECVKFLQEKGFSVNADIKENLLEDSQIALIVSLLKLTINQNDDIALASCMASPFSEFSLEELGQMRKTYPDGSFYEMIKMQNGQKIENFFNLIEEFKFNIHVFGIIASLEKLFLKKGFLYYLEGREDYQTKRLHINKLFSLIRSNNLDYSPQELVSMLENSTKEDRMVVDGGNSITVTTIHATKGLEYPIVILCGAGENLGKVYNKNYIITKEFGLASCLYSLTENLRLSSPAFLAGKITKKQSEWVDELMLFYVALTRAQNHLYIIGRGKEKDFSFANLSKQSSYLKLIFFALGENFTSQVFSQEVVQTINSRFNVVTEIDNGQTFSEENLMIKNENNCKFEKEIEKMNNFVYENKDLCKISFKNSVTGVSKLKEIEQYNVGEVLYQDEQEMPIEEREEQKLAREKAVEVGNSYHEALKLVDFNVIENFEHLEKEFEKIKPFMQDGYSQNIDLNLLLKNILILKKVVGKNQVFKEREFLMECTPSEIGFVVAENNQENNLIVQGIVDLFAIGEELILVDYKYTSTKDEKVIIERYKAQIDLYKNALEKAFLRKVDKSYLLSLKEGKLIKLD